MKIKLMAFAAVALLGAMTVFAGEEVKIASPFDLKFGSDELIARYPKLKLNRLSIIHQSIASDGRSPDLTKASWTNWYHRATVAFAKPYHGFDGAELCFTETGKKLYEYNLRKDCPENMSRTDCIKILEKIVAELNAHYGLKLKIEQRTVDLDKLAKRQSVPFAHTTSDFFVAESSNDIQASAYGMVNRKGGMSIGVMVYDSGLNAESVMRRGKFFEGAKKGGKKEPFCLPLGYKFGDVYTNKETIAVVPDCLTNWPARFNRDERVVPVAVKWRDFDCSCFRLTEFGRISSFAAVLSTNGIASVEAMEKWATEFLKSQKEELELAFLGKPHFYPQGGQPNDYRVAYMMFTPSAGGRLGVGSSVWTEVKRLDDGRAYLRISFETDEAKKLDAPQRRAAAAGSRRALKELFDLDFESETTNRTEEVGLSDWQRLEAPKGMFTEGHFGYEKGNGRLRHARLRRSYEGNVSKEDLAKDVQELARSIEAKAGHPLPLREASASFRTSEVAHKVEAGEVLCFGDWFGGLPPSGATAKVGDMRFEFSYSVPQYVKEGDRYRMVLKGGIIFTVYRETEYAK